MTVSCALHAGSPTTAVGATSHVYNPFSAAAELFRLQLLQLLAMLTTLCCVCVRPRCYMMKPRIIYCG